MATLTKDRAAPGKTKGIELAFAKLMFTGKERLRIYKKMASLIRNGVSLQMTLDILYDQASRGGKKKDHPVAIAIHSWRTAFRDGRPFGESLRGWAPATECMLVEAGEAGSSLDESLDNVIKLTTSGKKIRGALMGGLAYPIFLLVMLAGVLALFGYRVVPTFEQILPPSQWEGLGQIMYKVANFTTAYMPFIGAGIVGLLALFFITAPRWRGGIRAKLDSIPPWSLYRLINGSGFLMASAALITAGVAIPEVLRKLRRTSNPWMQERIDATLREVSQGANFGEALHRTGFRFPDSELVDDLRIYAGLSNFDETLASLADEWMEEGVAKVKAQTSILNAVALVLLGITIMVLVGGMFTLQQQISSSATQI